MVAARERSDDIRLDRVPVAEDGRASEVVDAISEAAEFDVAAVVLIGLMKGHSVDLEDECLAEEEVDAASADPHLLPEADTEAVQTERDHRFEAALGEATRRTQQPSDPWREPFQQPLLS